MMKVVTQSQYALKVVEPITDILKHHEIMQGWRIYYYDDAYEIV